MLFNISFDIHCNESHYIEVKTHQRCAIKRRVIFTLLGYGINPLPPPYPINFVHMSCQGFQFAQLPLQMQHRYFNIKTAS